MCTGFCILESQQLLRRVFLEIEDAVCTETNCAP
jgi:hypothetical protein